MNAHANGKLLDRLATLDADAQALMVRAAGIYKLSARGYHWVLKVARTIADLAGVEMVAQAHVAEALSYRRVDVRQILQQVG